MKKIKEFYKKENGTVIRYWQCVGEDKWRAETTPYKEVPYIETLNKKEEE